jgi:hypothetical protein
LKLQTHILKRKEAQEVHYNRKKKQGTEKQGKESTKGQHGYKPNTLKNPLNQYINNSSRLLVLFSIHRRDREHLKISPTTTSTNSTSLPPPVLQLFQPHGQKARHFGTSKSSKSLHNISLIFPSLPFDHQHIANNLTRRTGYEEVQNELLAKQRSSSKSIGQFHSIKTNELLFQFPNCLENPCMPMNIKPLLIRSLR